MIGVFDSGFGGLTVLKSIHARLPNVSTMYLGDNARTPYGSCTHAEIFAFALEGVRELFRRGCPLVILACNTASAQALRQIQQTILPAEFPDRRVLGVIRPTVEEIVARSPSGHIGIMATPATVGSGAYLREIAAVSSRIAVTQIACPGLVELIEAGHDRSPEMGELASLYTNDLLKADNAIDTVLLGCTHYPLIVDMIRDRMGDRNVVCQGEIVAEKLADYLRRHPDMDARIGKDGARHYLTTGNGRALSALASRFYGSDVRFDQARICSDD